MARKRLSMPFGNNMSSDDPAAEHVTRATARADQAPISRVAAEVSATGALEALAARMARARAEGRLVEALPLDAVEAGHLVRDRVGLDEEELTALVESLRLHGQRMAIDVIDLGQGRYGLISGWRRLTALHRLFEETRDPRFGHVLALLRRPEDAGAAYVAMVEENELRAGLSYYERARIAARAVEAGAFPDRQAALRTLYATASRAKRSKIGSFLVLVDTLDGALRFPAAIPERLGLALAARLSEPGSGVAMVQGLLATPAATAQEETGRLAALLRLPETDTPETDTAGPGEAEEVAAGIRLAARRGGGLILAGPGVDAAFRARLEAWLKGGLTLPGR